MIFDSQLLFSDAQSLVINASATALSTNVVDLGVPGTTALGGSPVADPGRGRPVKLLAQIVTAATGTSSTLKVQLLQSANSDMSSPDILLQTDDIALATLAAGYQFRIGELPQGISKRYVALKYLNNSGSNMTAGNITAGIVETRQENPSVG